MGNNFALDTLASSFFGMLLHVLYYKLIDKKSIVNDILAVIVVSIISIIGFTEFRNTLYIFSIPQFPILTFIALIILEKFHNKEPLKTIANLDTLSSKELLIVLIVIYAVLSTTAGPSFILFTLPFFVIDIVLANPLSKFFNDIHIKNTVNSNNGAQCKLKTSNYQQQPNQQQNQQQVQTPIIYANVVDKMNNWLKQNIIGQDEAIDMISIQIKTKVVMQEKTKRKEPNLGVFMSVGPTGVGKTETAKLIATYLQQFGYQYLFFQMSNFADIYASNTLVGSPKGYIGSQEGGALTRPLMQNPKAVIVFDEMEKAHGSLFKPLMGLIDDGYIQELSTGAYAKIDNAIIVFTSNLMQGTIRELSKNIFDPIERVNILRDVLQGKLDDAYKIINPSIIDADLKFLKNDSREGNPFFPPEFLGRITEIVPYRSLTDEDLYKLTYIEAMKLNIKDNDLINNIFNNYKYIAYKYGVRQYLIQIRPKLLNITTK